MKKQKLGNQRAVLIPQKREKAKVVKSKDRLDSTKTRESKSCGIKEPS
jgi:hypothetical protein